MGCVKNTVTVAAAAAGTQSAAAFDAIEAQLLAAGWTVIQYLANHGTGAVRGAIYRLPTLDPYHARPDFLLLGNASGLATLTIERLYDWNIQQAVPSVPNATVASSGGWQTGTWPSAGTPVANALSSQAQQVFSFAFDGTSTYVVRVLADDYGVSFAFQYGGYTQWGCYERPLDPNRSKRELRVLGQASADYPLTFAAPTGAVAAHVRFNIEGVTKDVTFPSAALSAFRICQEITRQCGGLVEAYFRPRLAPNRDEIVVRIPPARAPIGGYSTTRPQLSVTYQDPQTKLAGLSFNLGPSGANAWLVTAANPGAIHQNAFVFPTNSVRIGATVRNHTRSQAYTITSFTTTSTQDDTANLSGDTSTWVTTDNIEVYPGPEDHCHGTGAHGGLWQAVLSGAETSNITRGATRTVVLNDRYGEAQGHFEVGQNIIVANNGAAVVLGLSSVVGTFIHGEQVEVTLGTGLGTRGLVRGISGASLAVDTIRGASGHATAYNLIPWNTTATITGATSGATATISTITANPQIGWFALVQVTAVGQVNPAGGDYRTTLALALGDAAINASFAVGPCCAVGVRAKSLHSLNFGNLTPGAAPVPGNLPGFFVSTVSNADANENERNVFSTTMPAHEPDYETHSLGLAEFMNKYTTSSAAGIDLFSVFAHFRGVNSRSAQPSISDVLLEDFDTNRKWVVTGNFQISATFGAGGTPSSQQWICMGPGGPT